MKPFIEEINEEIERCWPEAPSKRPSFIFRVKEL